MSHEQTSKGKLIEGLYIANVFVLTSFILIFFVSASGFAELFYYTKRHPTLTTQGRIIESRMAWLRYSHKYPPTYTYVFKYAYKVGGRSYQSTAIYFSGTWNRPTEEEVLSYKVNSVHTVYYLQKYSHYAALRNQWLGRHWDCLYVSAAFLLTLVSFFFVNGKRKKLHSSKLSSQR